MSCPFTPPFFPCMTDDHVGLSRDHFARGWASALAGDGARPWAYATDHDRQSYRVGYGAGREALMLARRRHTRLAVEAIRRCQAAEGELADGGEPDFRLAELRAELPTLDETIEILAWDPTPDHRAVLKAHATALTGAAQRANPTNWL